MKNVQCPHCHKTVIWSIDSPYRPFCSERCRLIDLGAWADGSYAIPVSSSAPTSDSADEASENASELDEDPPKHSDNPSQKE